ncbi:MAG: glutaredoxin domain-containing protein [Proteobacteria bacterium]|nr:glutaredoxin domain-containing protein [Pseudomonadota bacterium]
MKLIVLISALLFTVSASAEILKWTDSDGKVHFGNRPPADAKTSIVEVRINTYESPSIEALQEVLNPRDKVVMYSAEWCGVCKKAKKYFKENNIKYKEYDIDRSSKGKKDFKKLGAKGVPVILVGDKRLNGFSAASFESIYN